MKSFLYRTFGNEVRTKLLLCLTHNPKNVSMLVNTCGLSQSAVSQHLRKLKQAGLVRSSKIGKEVFYALTRKEIGQICTLLMQLNRTIASGSH